MLKKEILFTSPRYGGTKLYQGNYGMYIFAYHGSNPLNPKSDQVLIISLLW